MRIFLVFSWLCSVALAQSGLELLGWQLTDDALCGSAKAAACRLSSVPTDEVGWRSALTSAAKAGARIVVVPSDALESLAAADRAAADANVRVAVVAGNNPEDALKSVAPYSKRIGLWADPAAWERAGTKPLAAIFMLRERLAGGTLTPGTVSEEFAKEAYRLDLKPLVWVLPTQDPKLKNTIDALVSHHAQYASRVSAFRLGEITPNEIARLDAAIPASAPAVPKKRRKLLVFDLNLGRFGHPSIPYANLAMQMMGRKTGAWEATVSSDPAILDPANLRQFDAVYLNNTIGDIFSTSAIQNAFAAYLAGGRGLIGNHATTLTATDWNEFGNILGARGASHRMTDEKVTITVEDSNPITQVFGKGPFEYADEIFRFKPPYSRDNLRVLLSVDPLKTNMNQGRCYGQCYRDDNDYPVAWIKPYGKGRVFYTTLGHNAYVFQDPKMLAFFLAGIQYALGDLKVEDAPRPRASVDINGALRELSKWNRGQDQAPVRGLQRLLSMPGSFEPALIAFLGGSASAAAKGEVCRQLADIGTAASVPALTRLLKNAETAEMARYALERIPAPQAVMALREALSNALNPKLHIALIYSVGRRHDEGSVGKLSNLLVSSDPSVAAAAANALGLIGTPEAEQALGSIPLTRVSAEALLNLADHAPKDRAAAIYRKLCDEKMPSEVRTPAIRGLARRTGGDSVPLLKSACLDASADVAAAAIAELARLDGGALIGIVPRLNDAGKIEALSQLAWARNRDAVPLLRDALSADVPELRIAAMNGLSEIGTEADVALLVQAASRPSSEAETAAARLALARIRAEGSDRALAAALGAAKTPTARLEVIRAIGERGTADATDALVAAAVEPDGRVRREALRALRNVATSEKVPSLLTLVTRAADDDRQDAERALSAAVRRAEQPEVKPIIAAYRSAANAKIKASLVSVLASTSSVEALPTVREALRSSDPDVQKAAVAGLSEWNSPEPLDDLLQVARTSQSESLKVLGLRGYIRLVQLPVGRPPSETAKLLGAAMKAATRPEEKKIILAAVQRVPAPESLELARAAEADSAVAAEAKAATAMLERSLAAQRRNE
jgi:HEAT repeat protein/type 1 glutamine amidotransferase